MSKEAALRAMREARYEEQAARRATGSKPARPAVRLAQPRAADPRAAATPAQAPPGDVLCGHRSMNGRTCTREQGHAAKNHRYS